MVLKPDSQTPYCALACAELLYQAGLPRDLYAIVPGPGSVVGTAILEHCDYLMFTGSARPAACSPSSAAVALIGFSAELGGKNAMIITRGANLDKVAKAATRACFSNAGQLCISIERIYVEEGIAAEFTAKFGDEVREMKLGTAYDFSADMGSLISEGQLKTVSGHVEDAKAKERHSDCRRQGPSRRRPAVLRADCADRRDVGDGVRGQRDLRAVGLDLPGRQRRRGVEKANDTEYGLNASVWAASTAEGEEIAARLRSGTVNVNEGYAFAWGSRRTDGRHGCVRGRPPARCGGPAEVHRGADHRDRPGAQPRPAVRHAADHLAEVAAADGAGRDETPRPHVREETSLPVGLTPGHQPTGDGVSSSVR